MLWGTNRASTAQDLYVFWGAATCRATWPVATKSIHKGYQWPTNIAHSLVCGTVESFNITMVLISWGQVPPIPYFGTHSKSISLLLVGIDRLGVCFHWKGWDGEVLLSRSISFTSHVSCKLSQKSFTNCVFQTPKFFITYFSKVCCEERNRPLDLHYSPGLVFFLTSTIVEPHGQTKCLAIMLFIFGVQNHKFWSDQRVHESHSCPTTYFWKSCLWSKPSAGERRE